MEQARAEPRSPASEEGPSSLPYASVAARASAAILDLVAVYLLFVIALVAAAGLVPFGASFEWLLPALAVAIPWLYFAGFESSAAKATPGKRQLSIIVTDAKGARISFARASLRFVGKIPLLATFGLALFTIYLDPRRRALDDMIAGTRVLDAEAAAPAGPRPWWRKAIVPVIVIGVVGWLGKTALDAQNDFHQRSRITMAMAPGENARSLVTEFYQRTGKLPQNSAEAGLPPASDSATEALSSVAIRDDGLVVITLARNHDWPNGGEITFVPARTPDGKSLKWRCHSTMPAKIIPAACRD
jgi:uncharacterized RDD family membrane protein YckC